MAVGTNISIGCHGVGKGRRPLYNLLLLVLLFGHLIPCSINFSSRRVMNPEGQTLWFSRRGLQTTLKS